MALPKSRKTMGHKLTEEEIKRLQEIARQQARSLSAQVTFMLRNALAQEEYSHEHRNHSL